MSPASSSASEIDQPYDLFISWSTKEVKSIAAEFKKFFTNVLSMEAFYSDGDIPSGQQWFPEIAKTLSVVKAGVVLLAPWNVYEPWMFVEAGAMFMAANCVVPYDSLKTRPLPDQYKALNALHQRGGHEATHDALFPAPGKESSPQGKGSECAIQETLDQV